MRTILFLLISLYACGQNNRPKPGVVNPEIKRLIDSATSIVMNIQDYEKSISILNQAASIDSNFAPIYSFKLSLELALKRYDDALVSLDHLTRLKPNVPEYYFTTGIVHDFKGDSNSASIFYTKALSKYNGLLDTMAVSNLNYYDALMNKAVTLIFMGKDEEGNKILTDIEVEITDPPFRELVASLKNRSKEEILNEWQASGSSVSESHAH